MNRNACFPSVYMGPDLEDSVENLLKIRERLVLDLNAVHPPKEELRTSYKEMLDRCSSARGGNLYFPYLGTGRGSGPFVELADGSVKYDLICGIGPHFFGHSHPGITRAMVYSSLMNTVMQGNLQQNVDTLDLLEDFLLLANCKGASFDHCFLTTTGAMANENAIKILFQKSSGAERLLAFSGCFSGRTMALSFMTDKANYRKGLPRALMVDYVPFFDFANQENSIQRSAQILEEHLNRYPGEYAGMCMELVQGEGGFYKASKEFIDSIVTVLQRHKIPIWVDEIQTFARTREPFAFQMFQLDSVVDLVTVGKVSQVCATLFTAEFKPKPGLISQTFTGSGSAISTCSYLLKNILQGSIPFGESSLNMEIHCKFVDKFQGIKSEFEADFEGPYGIGSMISFTVFQGDLVKTKLFIHRLFENGVISFIAGENPYRVRFLVPSPVLEDWHIDEIIDLLKKTLRELS